MTTPAINRSELLSPVTGEFHVTSSTGHNSSFEVNGHLEFFSESRPESKNSPFSSGPGSWRPPTEWFHNSVHVKLASDCNINFKSRIKYPWYPNQDPEIWNGISVGSYSWLGIIPYIKSKGFPMPDESSNVINRAEVTALNNARQGQLNLGEFLAEFRETVRLFTSRVTTVRKDVEHFRNRHTPKAWNDVKKCRGCRASQEWLELQYGWVPLMSDVFAALTILERGFAEKGLTANFYGSAYDTEQSLLTYHPSGYPSIGSDLDTHDLVMKIKTNHRCKVSLWYSLRNPTLAALASLGLINPVEIYWELVRYSFVLDWFLPIGPWLQSFTSDFGWDFKSGTRSYKREANGVVYKDGHSTAKPPDTIRTTYVSKADGCYFDKFEANSFRRDVYLHRPVPGLYYKNPLSAKHALNALALLRLAFR